MFEGQCGQGPSARFQFGRYPNTLHEFACASRNEARRREFFEQRPEKSKPKASVNSDTHCVDVSLLKGLHVVIASRATT